MLLPFYLGFWRSFYSCSILQCHFALKLQKKTLYSFEWTVPLESTSFRNMHQHNMNSNKEAARQHSVPHFLKDDQNRLTCSEPATSEAPWWSGGPEEVACFACSIVTDTSQPQNVCQSIRACSRFTSRQLWVRHCTPGVNMDLTFLLNANKHVPHWDKQTRCFYTKEGKTSRVAFAEFTRWPQKLIMESGVFPHRQQRRSLYWLVHL